MTSANLQKSQPLSYLAILQHLLDLTMQTAEAASAEGNHKVVIQAIREGTRVITLILKMTSAPESASDSFTDPGQSLRGVGGPAVPMADANSDLKTASRKPEKENCLARKWEKSGKLPGKIPCQAGNNKENQQDLQHQKNGGKHPPVLGPDTSSDHGPAVTSGNWLEDLAAGRLDFDILHALGAGRPLPGLLDDFKTENFPHPSLPQQTK